MNFLTNHVHQKMGFAGGAGASLLEVLIDHGTDLLEVGLLGFCGAVCSFLGSMFMQKLTKIKNKNYD